MKDGTSRNLTSWLGQMKSLTFTGYVVVSHTPFLCRCCCCCCCACFGGFWRVLRFLSFRLLPCFGFLLLDARVWKPSRPFVARRFTRVRRPALVLRVPCASSVRNFSGFWMLLGFQKLGAGWEASWVGLGGAVSRRVANLVTQLPHASLTGRSFV